MTGFYEQVKKDLQAYYESQGIIPGARFSCKYQEQCPGQLARGMQCHIGSRYGEKMRIVVASLDCGNGGAEEIDGRTGDVVTSAEESKLDPHMKGTYKALAYFYDEQDPGKLVHYMAMTNTCKCCKLDSTEHMSVNYYWNCREYTVAEIHLLKPDVILFQGKFAPIGCNEMLSVIEGIDDADVAQYLRLFSYQDVVCYAVICIHPSARGRTVRKRIQFYDVILPKVAEYIKSHPLDNQK